MLLCCQKKLQWLVYFRQYLPTYFEIFKFSGVIENIRSKEPWATYLSLPKTSHVDPIFVKYLAYSHSTCVYYFDLKLFMFLQLHWWFDESEESETASQLSLIRKSVDTPLCNRNIWIYVMYLPESLLIFSNDAKPFSSFSSVTLLT